MDMIITFFCSSIDNVGVEDGVEVFCGVGELVGEIGAGLVYCSHPVNIRDKNVVMKSRLNATRV